MRSPRSRSSRAPRGRLAPLWLAALTFANFESHQIHPLELSADGERLFAVNTPDNRLTVFRVTAEGLEIESEVPVGLEPVSVRQRSAGEVWVVNHLSDDVSVVDLATMNVRRTIQAGDEPTDVVFAGPGRGRAFVCVSQEDAVKIYPVANAAAPPVVVPLRGSDPRALATSPDGSRVYVTIFEAGNRTSVLSPDEVRAGGGPPEPDPPMDPALPPPPRNGLIVRWSGAAWLDETGARDWGAAVPLPYTVSDHGLAALDAGAAVPSPVYFDGVGALNFNLTVNPVTGRVYVANTSAENLTRFEPNLRGRFARNRVTIVDPAAGSVTPVHLNPHIDYGVSPGPPGEIALSLAQPNAGAWDARGETLYLACLGSGMLAMLDAAGNVIARVEVGGGPTAAAVDEARGRIYVLDRFANRVLVVDRATRAVVAQAEPGFQPEPPAVSEGRRFLYDARLSAHGDLSCATCHAFANFDNLAWDLGDPRGAMEPAFQPFLPDHHPMKGPVTTQSLRGLAATEPFHWRGDRAAFGDFNATFTNLMGARDSLPAGDMRAFTDFIMTVLYPPNPNQNLDRGWADPPPPAPSAERGRISFTTRPHLGGLLCQDCHQSEPGGDPFLVAPGTSRALIPGSVLDEDQTFKVPHLRNLYEKTGFSEAPGEWPRGFGFGHDGAFDTILRFLQRPVFAFADDAERRDVEAFLLAFDTGTAPAVGAQVTVDRGNRDDPALAARVALLVSRADAGDVDLVAKGRVNGEARGFLYAGGGAFLTDRAAEPPLSAAKLRSLATAGGEITFTAVTPGSGERLGVDRDGDGVRDGDESAAAATTVAAAGAPGGEAPAAGGPAAAPALTLSPNPFDAAGTTLSFTLAAPAEVSLAVYDVRGRAVATPLPRARRQGTVSVEWKGRDDAGRALPPGLYYARVSTGGRIEARPLLFAR